MTPQVEETTSKLASGSSSARSHRPGSRSARPSSARAPRGLDQRRREIDAGHVGAARRGALGDRAGAARQVQPPHAGPRIEPLDHEFVDVGDRLGDPLVGAGPPHHALALLQLLVRHGFRWSSQRVPWRRRTLSTSAPPRPVTVNMAAAPIPAPAKSKPSPAGTSTTRTRVSARAVVCDGARRSAEPAPVTPRQRRRTRRERAAEAAVQDHLGYLRSSGGRRRS